MTASIVLGLINGLVTALLAVGLVLVYKAGRFVNFAQAQLGVVSALLLGKLVLDVGLSWWLAFPVAVAAGGLIGGLAERLVIRPLAGRSRITLLIATIGLAQVLLALTYFTWLGPNRFTLSAKGYPLPFHPTFSVGELVLGGKDVLILILVPTLALALAVTLKRTTLGKAIRAAASNPDAAGLAGISVHRVSTVTWVIAGGLSAVSAILAAPAQAVFDTSALGPELLLLTLGAAALAGFTSLPAAFSAAVGLGVVQSLTVHFTHDSGSGEAVVFLAIVAGLLLRSRAIEAAIADRRDGADPSERSVRVPDVLAAKAWVRHQRGLLFAAALFVGLLAPALPVFRPEPKVFILTLTLTFALVGVSLTLLTGWGGQVSLGQFALVGVGALIAARLAPHGWSLPVEMVVAGVVSAVVAVLVGLPALRLHGLTLAIMTLGLAVVGPAWLFRQSWFAPQGSISVPAPRVAGLGAFDSPRSVYYVALAVLVLAGSAAAALRRSGPGRVIRAVRDSDSVAASFGIAPTTIKLSLFALSGFIAGVAGVLWLSAERNFSLQYLAPEQSLVMLSIPVIGGLSSLAGAVLGAIFVFAVPAFAGDLVRSVFPNTLQFQLFVGGVGLLFVQIAYPGGIASVCRRWWETFLERAAAAERQRLLALADIEAGTGTVLEVRDVSVAFGGVTALDHLSVHVQDGEIVGLIGANGAGKTTLINVISGALPPDAGSVLALGHQLSGLGPEFRAHFGIARSFQDAGLFPGLSVRETIQVALHHQTRVGMASALASAPWSRSAERRLRARADEIVDSFRLTGWADTPTSELSTGLRRMCDLAAQVALRPRLLLLDEPTAGVAQRDAEAFVPLLRRIVADMGCAVLLVEHDMGMMLSLADRIYCLEAGRVIAEGTPEKTRLNPAVIASYLGTDEAAVHRSGRTLVPPPRRASAGARANGRSSGSAKTREPTVRRTTSRKSNDASRGAVQVATPAPASSARGARNGRVRKEAKL